MSSRGGDSELERPELLTGFIAAIDHREMLLDIVAAAVDEDEAVSAISGAFGLSNMTSRSVLDMQYDDSWWRIVTSFRPN